MKGFFVSLRISCINLLLLTLLCGIVYPLIMGFIGFLFFPKEASGSILHLGSKVIGSEKIAQAFVSPKYFHPRPSFANYDAANSNASNLAPTSKKLLEEIQKKIEEYRRENHLNEDILLPAEAVTSSGSGLDPDISVRNALLQIPRVAAARGIAEEKIKELLFEKIDPPFLGFIGEERVNVLLLNLILDSQK